MLMQPKNDHILFAFFGLSLQIRKRSMASALRSRITMKRKIERVLKMKMYAPFLLRDPEAPDFPYFEKKKKLRWCVRDNRGMDFRGVGFACNEYLAYANDKGEWDMANAFNHAIPEHDNPWLEAEDLYPSKDDRAELWDFESKMQPDYKARLSVVAFIPFESIVALDETGDECFDSGQGLPTLYVPFFEDGSITVHEHKDVRLMTGIDAEVELDKTKRVKFFPNKFRRDEFN
jgi:hypothetical protein